MIELIPLRIPVPHQANTFISPVLLCSGGELILVDAGFLGQAHVIKKAVTEQGIDISGVSKIVVTHHDFDHVGSLCELQQLTGAVVMASAAEAPFVEGKKKPLRLTQLEDLFPVLPSGEKEGARQFEQLLKSIQPCKVNQILKEGDAVDRAGKITVCSTPGHTAGHISLLINETATLIAGDALVWENGVLQLANPQYAEDIAAARDSAKRIREMNLATIICYHGGVCKGFGKEQFQIG
jgi:glyoxylase-like metal-dependent hydrolase (beta-lactamase superfamily II)